MSCLWFEVRPVPWRQLEAKNLLLQGNVDVDRKGVERFLLSPPEQFHPWWTLNLLNPLPNARLSGVHPTLEIQRYRIKDYWLPCHCSVHSGAWCSQTWSHFFFFNQVKHQVVQALRAPCLLSWNKSSLLRFLLARICYPERWIQISLAPGCEYSKGVLFSIRSMAALVHCLAYPREGYKNQ